jgi:hypothetical protein
MEGRRWLAVAAAAGVLVAGCGGGGGSNSPSGGGTKKSALAYSQCMRSHGVSDFPDPNASGQIELKAGPGSDLTPDSPVFTKAQQACKSLEQAMAGSPTEQRKNYAQALKFAKCMRAHGVTNLPDPQPPGSGPQSASRKVGPNGQSGNGPDPSSPIFKKAQQACRSLLPSGAELSTNQAGGDQ